MIVKYLKFSIIETNKRRSVNDDDFFLKVHVYLRGNRCDYSPRAPGNLATPLHIIDTNIYKHNERTESKFKITYVDRLLYVTFFKNRLNFTH